MMLPTANIGPLHVASEVSPAGPLLRASAVLAAIAAGLPAHPMPAMMMGRLEAGLLEASKGVRWQDWVEQLLVARLGYVALLLTNTSAASRKLLTDVEGSFAEIDRTTGKRLTVLTCAKPPPEWSPDDPEAEPSWLRQYKADQFVEMLTPQGQERAKESFQSQVSSYKGTLPALSFLDVTRGPSESYVTGVSATVGWISNAAEATECFEVIGRLADEEWSKQHPATPAAFAERLYSITSPLLWLAARRRVRRWGKTLRDLRDTLKP